ncbi:MAG: response regulator transcription factor [Bacilli bacterium]|nr:response regulator transcription factor [Bacilli bacterium]
MYNICLVEDEKDLNHLIKSYLERENYSVTSYLTGNDAIKHINDNFDLWVIDIMLSDEVSGYDIIKKIREIDSNKPVIFTSARDQDLDKIIGLELGSDDYITKPYSPKELILRINNIIKRVYNKPQKKIYETYEIDFDKRVVIEDSKEIELTTLEFELLMLLLNNQNTSLSRDDILTGVWGSDYFGSDRVVDDLVRRLRRKMPKIKINTIYGFGYRLV